MTVLGKEVSIPAAGELTRISLRAVGRLKLRTTRDAHSNPCQNSWPRQFHTEHHKSSQFIGSVLVVRNDTPLDVHPIKYDICRKIYGFSIRLPHTTNVGCLYISDLDIHIDPDQPHENVHHKAAQREGFFIGGAGFVDGAKG